MGTHLNSLEMAIIEEIVSTKGEQYPLLKNHIPFLRVKSREKTGVGVYVNFEYEEFQTLSKVTEMDDLVLTSEKSLELDVLQYGLNYELNLTKGRIAFLELVTNGEHWDGIFGKFTFIE